MEVTKWAKLTKVEPQIFIHFLRMLALDIPSHYLGSVIDFSVDSDLLVTPSKSCVYCFGLQNL